MEPKTIGKFITALRKANGMTQKDLAEKLNVSDKTVSRWERDDGAPDLSLIPVIAEIFGVTCDELLRGERKPPAERAAEPQEPSARGEKQRRRILSMSLSRYRTQSFISMGISAVGLIAAMICNLGFLRAYIGFFAGAIFYVASLVCQAVFLNGAFLSVEDDSFSGEEVDRFKQSVMDLGVRTIGVTAVLLAATLPLLIFPRDAYVGLSGDSWLQYGLLFGVLTLLLYSTAAYLLKVRQYKKGQGILNEKESARFWHNHALKRRCAVFLAAVLLSTILVHSLANNLWSPWNLAEGTEFYDYESFVEFMEQDLQYSSGAYAQEPANRVAYYDAYGNPISEEEALREELRISDGTPEGKVVCEYLHRNQTVASIRPADTADGLPVTVITGEGLAIGRSWNNLLNIVFIALYLLEAAGTGAMYLKKRAK